MNEMHLVTGGSGYFGSLLVKKIREQGFKTRIFDMNDAHDRPTDVEFVQGDVRNLDAVRNACKGCHVVHHNVAMVPLAKDKDAFWSVNVTGMQNLLEACKEEGVGKVIHTSSSAVFGIPSKNPVDDSVAPNPQEAYGRAKLQAENLCNEYAEKGMDISIIRPRTIMGHGRLGIMQILFEWIRKGNNIPVLGKGDNIYQFVHADDLADACVRASSRKSRAIYNVGAGQFGTMRQTLVGLISHAGTASKIVSLPMSPAIKLMELTSALNLSPLGPYHSLMYGRSMYFDIARTKKELDWEPKYSNIEMFCESYDWYIKNRDKILGQEGLSHHRSAVNQGVLKIVGWGLRFF